MKKIKQQKQLKQPLHHKGYLTNPQGYNTPILTTKAPVVAPELKGMREGSSLPGARKKLK
jgi:hypothetical protein